MVAEGAALMFWAERLCYIIMVNVFAILLQKLGAWCGLICGTCGVFYSGAYKFESLFVNLIKTLICSHKK